MVISSTSSVELALVRTVNSQYGNDSEQCLQGKISCQTLHYALTDLVNEVEIVITTPNLTHSKSSIVSQVSYLTISSNVSATVYCNNSGISFNRVNHLNITNINFYNCSACHNSTSYMNHAKGGAVYPVFYLVGLYIINSTDVSMATVVVQDSPGVGMAMLNVTGSVKMEKVQFINNGALISRDGVNDTSALGSSCSCPRLAGSALMIEFPSCSPGLNISDCRGLNDQCPNYTRSDLPKYQNVSYIFDSCSFVNNTAETPDYKTYSFIDYPVTSSFVAIGRGGGISLFIKGISKNIAISVVGCSFINNWALYGGGLFMEYWHYPDNVSLTVLNSTFSNNVLPYLPNHNFGTGGGSIRYSHYYCSKQYAGNEIIIEGSKFDGNRAYYGGAVSLKLAPQNCSDCQTTSKVEDSVFCNNTARIGAALIVVPQYPFIQSPDPGLVLLSNNFTGNSLNYAPSLIAYIRGEGIVYSLGSPINLRQANNFENNGGTGLVLSDESVHFAENSFTCFSNNSAFRGGGIALYDKSKMKLCENSSVVFQNNRAETVGGAIFHARTGNAALLDSGQCPFTYSKELEPDDWNCTLSFVNNNASIRGNSIYLYSIFPCIVQNFDSINTTIVRWKPFKFHCNASENENCTDLEVSGDASGSEPKDHTIVALSDGSSPFLFQTSDEHTYEMNTRFQGTHPGGYNVIAFPGETVPLPFQPLDEYGHKVSTRFDGTITERDRLHCSVQLHQTAITVRGIPNHNETVLVVLSSMDWQTYKVILNLNITYCPPGYHLSAQNSTATCTCFTAKKITLPGVDCFTISSSLNVSANYWVGYDGNIDYFTGTGLCPTGYCRSTSYSINSSLHFSLSELDQYVCGPQGRTGVLCGDCKQDYIFAYFSSTYECVQHESQSSSSGFPIWFFLEFVPMNVLLVLFIVFDVNILTKFGGILYTYVFFCQVVLLTPAFQSFKPAFDDTFSGILYLCRIYCRFWNLDFFVTFVPPNYLTFFQGATIQGAIAFNYFVILLWPLFVYSLLIIIHWCYRKQYCYFCCNPCNTCLEQTGNRILRCQGENSSRGLAGLCSYFVLAFTREAVQAYDIFTSTPIYWEDGRSEKRFRYNATAKFFETGHLEYVAPILITSLITLIPPCLLLFIFPLISKLCKKLGIEEKRSGRFLLNMQHFFKPICDIFQGCLNENREFFASLYLIYRLIFVFLRPLNSTPDTYSDALVVVMAGIVLLHSCGQPFKSPTVNAVTGVTLSSLLVVITLGPHVVLPRTVIGEVVFLFFLFLPHVILGCLCINNLRKVFRARYLRFKANRMQKLPNAKEDAHSTESSVSATGDNENYQAMASILDRDVGKFASANRHTETAALIHKSDGVNPKHVQYQSV